MTTTSDGWRWNIQLSQSIFRWDQWISLKKSSKQVAQAEADYQAAGQDLMVRVAVAYFDVLAAQDTLESEQAAKEAIGRQLEQAKKRFEVGLIAITDVQEAQAGYDQAVATEITCQAQSRHEAGIAARDRRRVPDRELTSPKAEIPLVSPDPEDEDAWVETALHQNFLVLSSELGAEIAKDDFRVAKTRHYPTIDLVASYTAKRTSPGIGTTSGTAIAANDHDTDRNRFDDESIQVRFAIPILSGGTVSAQRREAMYRHKAAQERFERTVRQTERETRDAYLGVTSEISRVKALKQALKSSQTALQATEAGFDVGTRTTVDVLDQRRQLFIADVNYARSRYDYIINVLLLKQAAGTLNPDDVIEVNGWLAAIIGSIRFSSRCSVPRLLLDNLAARPAPPPAFSSAGSSNSIVDPGGDFCQPSCTTCADPSSISRSAISGALKCMRPGQHGQTQRSRLE